jgi:hypothetical protein
VVIGLGAVSSIHDGGVRPRTVALYQGLVAGSPVVTGLLFELFFRNPPVERGSTQVGGTIAGVGWLHGHPVAVRPSIHPDTNQVPRLLADRPGELVLTGNTRPSWYPIRVRVYIHTRFLDSPHGSSTPPGRRTKRSDTARDWIRYSDMQFIEGEPDR